MNRRIDRLALVVVLLIPIAFVAGIIVHDKVMTAGDRNLAQLQEAQGQVDDDSDIDRIVQVRDVKVTGYTLDPKECGKSRQHKDFGRGASGKIVQIGDCAMTDVPFGTRVILAKRINGCLYQTVQDTGNFDGRTVDIFCGDGKKAKELARSITGKYVAIILKPK